jgi:hypothetical protein
MALSRVETDGIKDSAITAIKIADGTVVAAEIASNAVTTIKINADAVDGTKLADNALDSEHYTDGSIDNVHLATGIAASKLTGSLPALTLAGALTGADQIVSAINLKDYGHITNAIGGTGGGTQDINLTLGNSISATVDTSANTFTFSNPTASDELSMFILFLTNGGSQTVNWPGTVDWAGGTAPTLTTAGLDILTFFTLDGGTIWHGVANSADSK